jgi:hypothetical protein
MSQKNSNNLTSNIISEDKKSEEYSSPTVNEHFSMSTKYEELQQKFKEQNILLEKLMKNEKEASEEDKEIDEEEDDEIDTEEYEKEKNNIISINNNQDVTTINFDEIIKR